MSDNFFSDVTSFLHDTQGVVDAAQGLVSDVQAAPGGTYPPQSGAVSEPAVPMWIWIVGGAAIILALMWGSGTFSKKR